MLSSMCSKTDLERNYEKEEEELKTESTPIDARVSCCSFEPQVEIDVIRDRILEKMERLRRWRQTKEPLPKTQAELKNFTTNGKGLASHDGRHFVSVRDEH